MALIDVVKWEANDRELVHKFPSEDLRIGTQLVVYAGQTAFFVKEGLGYRLRWFTPVAEEEPPGNWQVIETTEGMFC